MQDVPDLEVLGPERRVRCIRSENLELTGTAR
jgi:hypothetical protein